MPLEIHIIILLIYTISIFAAFFCLWIRWEQDEIRMEMQEIINNQKEIQKQIEALNKELNRMNIKSPFNGR